MLATLTPIKTSAPFIASASVPLTWFLLVSFASSAFAGLIFNVQPIFGYYAFRIANYDFFYGSAGILLMSCAQKHFCYSRPSRTRAVDDHP